MKAILLTSFMFVLSGCATLPRCEDPVAANEPAGRIIVYREAAFIGFAAVQNIAVNDCKLGTLRNGSYVAGRFRAGEHELSVLSDFGKKQNPQVFEVRAGVDHYVRWSFDVQDVYVVGSTAGGTGNHVFTEVSRATAVEEVQKLEAFE